MITFKIVETTFDYVQPLFVFAVFMFNMFYVDISDHVYYVLTMLFYVWKLLRTISITFNSLYNFPKGAETFVVVVFMFNNFQCLKLLRPLWFVVDCFLITFPKCACPSFSIFNILCLCDFQHRCDRFLILNK